MDVRRSLGSDHEAIDRRLTDLGNAVEGADFPTILEVFRGIDCGLRAHMDGEETYLFEHFEKAHPADIAQLHRAHEEFRRALDKLMVDAELHTLRQEPIDHLIAQLRAHAKKENETLYRWADDSPRQATRDALFEYLERHRMKLRENRPTPT